MFNENAELFCRTLYGVMKNIAHLCGRKNSRVWGKDGWKKVSKQPVHTLRVCRWSCVSLQMDERVSTPKFLTAWLHWECSRRVSFHISVELISRCNDKYGQGETGHSARFRVHYELCSRSSTSVSVSRQGYCPVPDHLLHERAQCEFVHRPADLVQARKINSHRWFFNAFAPLLSVS